MSIRAKQQQQKSFLYKIWLSVSFNSVSRQVQCAPVLRTQNLAKQMGLPSIAADEWPHLGT